MTAPPAAAPSFLTRVREGFASLHPTEKRLAEFVLDFPGELASYSASELARLSGVSNATVTRFVRRLGYANFEAARHHVREQKQTGSPLFLAGRGTGNLASAAAGAHLEGSLEAHLAQGKDNLLSTFTRFSDDEIEAIALTLLAARKVWVTGFRSSQSLATYLQWQIFQVKEDIQVFPSPGGTFGESIGSIVADDLVVVFGLRRRPARLRMIMNQLVRSGARVLLISDENLARNASVTWHLQCACAAPGPLDNHVAVIALCHLLANRVVELSDHAGRERLAAIEARHDALGEF
jgi:DNA-binding MurR/RpiR family transcriptional regulator